MSYTNSLGYNITQIKVRLEHRDEGIIINEDLNIDDNSERAYGTINSVIVGTWDLTIELFENKVLVGSGTGESVVKDGESAKVTVKINLDTGNVEIIVDWGNESNTLIFGSNILLPPDEFMSSAISPTGDFNSFIFTTDNGVVVAFISESKALFGETSANDVLENSIDTLNC